MTAQPVLLVDRDTEWCARVTRFLQSQGISAVTAETVDAAAERLASMEAPVALVFESTARQTARAAIADLRRQPRLHGIPIGFVRKDAALDSLVFMLRSSAADAQHHAA